MRLVFVAFDLMHLSGEDLRHRPLVERRAALAGLLGHGWSGAIPSASTSRAKAPSSSIERKASALRGWCRSGRASHTKAAARSLAEGPSATIGIDL
jgi:ATP-dependent DNA ligase